MSNVIPDRLSEGSHVRVIAPSYSMRVIGAEAISNAQRVFEDELGLTVSYGRHTAEIDEDNSSSVSSRLDDLHEAIADHSVDAIIPVIGGYNANQLLSHIDWELVADNPKILGGYSDITTLQAAFLAKAGLVSYASPNFSTFGQRHLSPYTVESFRRATFASTPYNLEASPEWSDDKWYLDQEARSWMPNEGYWIIQPGQAEGLIIGTTLSVLGALRGTEYIPSTDDPVILAVEDYDRSNIYYFERELDSLTLSQAFPRIVGIIMGRFQKQSHVTREQIERLIRHKPELKDVPVIANVDFGHTDPMATLPVGGSARLSAGESHLIEILEH